MGLDMWMYKVKKMTEEDVKAVIGKTTQEIDKMGYKYFDYSEVKSQEDKEMFEDLMPYGVFVNATVQVFNEEKLKKAKKIAASAYCCYTRYGHEDVTMIYQGVIGTRKTITLTPKDYEKYVENVCHKLFVYKGEEVMYWRKAYDIQEAIYEDYHYDTGKNIQNCGYHLMTEKTIRDIEDRYDCDFGYVGDDEALFYHEWY